jgi:hypothetical protein
LVHQPELQRCQVTQHDQLLNLCRLVVLKANFMNHS